MAVSGIENSSSTCSAIHHSRTPSFLPSETVVNFSTVLFLQNLRVISYFPYFQHLLGAVGAGYIALCSTTRFRRKRPTPHRLIRFAEDAGSDTVSPAQCLTGLMATDALTAFIQRDFARAEEALLSLKSNASDDLQNGDSSKDDPRIQHNILISKFYADNTRENLENFITFVFELLPKEQRPASIRHFLSHSVGNRELLKLLCNTVGPVALFNVAVVAYHLGHPKSAASVGELLYSCIEAIDDWLALRICFLLIDVHLRLRDVDSAAKMASYAEKLLISFSKGHTESEDLSSDLKTLTPDWNGRSQGILEAPASYNDAKFCMHVYNARLNVDGEGDADSARGVRKEAKHALVAADDTETRPTAGALLVKARVEQNYAKSFRILGSIVTQSPPNIIKKVRPLVLNTLGVLHHRLGRHALAACYFEHSRKALDILLREECSNTNLIYLNILSTAKDTQVSYNLALQYMGLGDYARALDLFVICARTDLSTANNSAIMWLRMAECCIGIDNSSNGGQALDIHGQGRCRRLLMHSAKRDDAPLMEYAATCARAAVAILDRRKSNAHDSETQKAKRYSIVPDTGARQLKGDQTASAVLSLSVHDLRVRAAALTIIAYASLAFDPNAVIVASDELERMHARSDSDRCELAWLYSAEAYCILGRTDDAANRIARLLPADNPGDSSIREMAYVNMALTHVCKGDLEAGSRAAKLAIKTFSAQQDRSKLLQRETIFATTYIFLRNGEVDVARRCIRMLLEAGE